MQVKRWFVVLLLLVEPHILLPWVVGHVEFGGYLTEQKQQWIPENGDSVKLVS
jgi:hypothetical protein